MRHSQKVLIILFPLLLCCSSGWTISFAMDPCTISVTQGDAQKDIFDTVTLESSTL